MLMCSCEYCRSGKYNLCPDIKFAATPPYDGTLTKYYIVPYDMVTKLPENVSLEEGALMEPLSVAIHICRQAEISAHKTVVVFGAGPVGLLVAAVAKAWGASQVITVDIIQGRLDFASKFASSGTFLPEKPAEGESNIDYSQKVADKIKKEFNLGEGADCVIEATGAEVCTLTGLYACGKGATFVQAGMGKAVLSAFPITLICTREINVKGSFRYTHGCYRGTSFTLLY
jgi:D-xylulose reductase